MFCSSSSAHSFIELPRKLKITKAIINIQNTNDHRCFICSVPAALHPAEHNPQRVQHYTPYEHELNINGIDMPVKLQQIPKFEKQNEISVNVFGYEEGVYPLHISSFRFPRHINLLLITDGEQNHYCLIRDLGRLLNHQSQNRHKKFVCPYCLHCYTRQDLLDKHKSYCQTHTP